MEILHYSQCENKAVWLEQIRRYEWRAAAYLTSLLEADQLHCAIGQGELLLLTEGEKLVSFATFGQRDCIDDTSLGPWIGFVHTAPEYRGRRCAGVLIDYALDMARAQHVDKVYICTDHKGLYEKYGFTYLFSRRDIYGSMEDILVREV